MRELATVATRKRKTVYPPARTDTKPAQRPGAGPEPYVRPTVATIDLTAGGGRAGLSIGDRVRIAGRGLYSGEAAVIEKLPSGVIPAALVRTEAGRTRQVRTIDLEPIARDSRSRPATCHRVARPRGNHLSSSDDDPHDRGPRRQPPRRRRGRR